MARFDQAKWRPIPAFNYTKGGMRTVRGIVLHIMQGTLAGTDAWFRNSAAQASAHFGVGTDGTIYQWVDTDDKAWAQAQGNTQWISVENEGYSGFSLTDAQLKANAAILYWAYQEEGVALQLADDVSSRGLGYHGMGGAAWGGHTNCPGDPIVDQRQKIVALAKKNLEPDVKVEPMYSPPLSLRPIVADLKAPQGVWLLGDDGSVYAFGGAPYRGGPNGKSYFVGRKPARLEAPNKEESAAGNLYTVVATSGERYSY